jgi:hypothetical protein
MFRHSFHDCRNLTVNRIDVSLERIDGGRVTITTGGPHETRLAVFTGSAIPPRFPIFDLGKPRRNHRAEIRL